MKKFVLALAVAGAITTSNLFASKIDSNESKTVNSVLLAKDKGGPKNEAKKFKKKKKQHRKLARINNEQYRVAKSQDRLNKKAKKLNKKKVQLQTKEGRIAK